MFLSEKNSVPGPSFSDAFFQTVFQTSPDAALVSRVCDGAIMHVNDGFCRITGYSREEVIGKTTRELDLYFNFEDRDLFLASMAETGILETRPADFRRRDGSRYAALISARSFWSQGYEYVCASIRDISEQQRAEQMNCERDEELRRLFETMTQGIVYQDAQGNIISANPAAIRMLGLSLFELSQRTSYTTEWKTIREDGTPLPGSEHPSMIALRTGKPFGPYALGVYNEKLSDHIWVSVFATPLFHEGESKPYQVYVIMDDITAQRKAQQNYQQLFHEMMDGFALHEIICDENGKPIDYRYVAVNPAFERMTGLRADSLIGKTVRDVLPETEQYWIDIYGQVALTGVPVTFQNYAATLEKYFNVTAYRPAPMQFACTFSDVTHQMHYQQETEKAQEQINRLAHICDVAPSSIVVINESGRILYANEYTAQLHGYSKSELLDKYLYELTDNTQSTGLEKFIQALQLEGERVIKKSALAQNGSTIPLLIYAKSIVWDGEPAVLSIGTNLTEQLKAERTLQESLEQNRRILDNLQDGFYRADLDGNFFMLNPRMAEIFGYETVESMLPTSAKLIYANLDDRVALFEKLKVGGRVTSHVCQVKRQDGTPLWVSMHIQYLKNDAGEIIGTEGLIRDITERRKLEQEVQKQHESLIETNQVLKKRLEQSINALSKMAELRDVYTAGHQKRVQQLACEIGRRFGMTPEAITNLAYGALIHDIGKIYIASDILNKPGKITNLEYQILQTHAEYSYNIAREMDLPQVILTMMLQHHERLDGSGYPNKLVGEQIILESRILAVADVVEAMTSHRPYRPALGIEAALSEIESGRGIKFDPAVVDLCISLFREEGFAFATESEPA